MLGDRANAGAEDLLAGIARWVVGGAEHDGGETRQGASLLDHMRYVESDGQERLEP